MSDPKEMKINDPGKVRPVHIIVHKAESDPKSTHAYVSVQGKTWQIQRGERVEVPGYVAECLDHAVKEVYVQDDVSKEIIMKEVHSYPFSIIE